MERDRIETQLSPEAIRLHALRLAVEAYPRSARPAGGELSLAEEYVAWIVGGGAKADKVAKSNKVAKVATGPLKVQPPPRPADADDDGGDGGFETIPPTPGLPSGPPAGDGGGAPAMPPSLRQAGKT